jgi:hypothetical protein
MSTAIEVKESVRRIVSVTGAEKRLHNVTSVDNSGSWLRIQSDEGYVLINPDNVLLMVVKGERVF